MHARPDSSLHRAIEAEIRTSILTGAPPPRGIATGDTIEAARRFSVYRNNVRVGLVDALDSRFPAVARLVGREFFRAMAGAFVGGHPPRSPILAFYGDAFADFIAAFPPASRLAYLADVARLEASRTHAYHAADAAPLAASALAAVAERDPGGWGLALHPALRIVASAYPIVTIWAMNRPGGTPAPIAAPASEAALVARPALEVTVVGAEPGEPAFLAACATGASFADAAAAAMHADDGFDPSRTLARILAFGFAAGVTTITGAKP